MNIFVFLLCLCLIQLVKLETIDPLSSSLKPELTETLPLGSIDGLEVKGTKNKNENVNMDQDTIEKDIVEWKPKEASKKPHFKSVLDYLEQESNAESITEGYLRFQPTPIQSTLTTRPTLTYTIPKTQSSVTTSSVAATPTPRQHSRLPKSHSIKVYFFFDEFAKKHYPLQNSFCVLKSDYDSFLHVIREQYSFMLENKVMTQAESLTFLNKLKQFKKLVAVGCPVLGNVKFNNYPVKLKCIHSKDFTDLLNKFNHILKGLYIARKDLSYYVKTARRDHVHHLTHFYNILYDYVFSFQLSRNHIQDFELQ